MASPAKYESALLVIGILFGVGAVFAGNSSFRLFFDMLRGGTQVGLELFFQRPAMRRWALFYSRRSIATAYCCSEQLVFSFPLRIYGVSGGKGARMRNGFLMVYECCSL